jgi:4a-hydroxytetrahydrobiopterin dehydratase
LHSGLENATPSDDGSLDAGTQSLIPYLRFMQEWIVDDDGKLFKQFRFADFSACLGFMVRAGIIMEQMNHHAEWFNVYNRLEVWLCTHDAGNNITDKDRQLAKQLDKLFLNLYPNS